MKKIFILIALILISITGFSQLKAVFTVATDSTTFGIAIPKKTLVFDYGANIMYRVDTLGNMSSTVKSLGLDRVNSGNAVSALNATYLDPNTCQLSLKIDTITACNKVTIRGGLNIDTVMTMSGHFLLYQNEPLGNVMFGRGAGDVMIYDTIPHYSNTAIGINALNANKGDQNTAIGLNAGMQNRGSNNIFIGYRAGNYDTTSSNTLIINSIDRDSLSKELTHSIIVGVQNADSSQQRLDLNANVNISQSANVGSNLSVAGGLNVGTVSNVKSDSILCIRNDSVYYRLPYDFPINQADTSDIATYADSARISNTANYTRITNVTYSQLTTLITTKTLKAGNNYRITDFAQARIILTIFNTHIPEILFIFEAKLFLWRQH